LGLENNRILEIAPCCAIGTRNQAELHLSWLVKNYLENTELAHAIDAFHKTYLSSKPPQMLKCEEIH
jgi:hypothetical protein